jgi:hypothetical protein
MICTDRFRVTRYSSLISDLVHYAKRFIAKSRLIVDQAPLQVYCAGLVFAPRTGIIRREFKRSLPTWICQLPQVEEEWSTLTQTLEGHSGGVGSVAFSSTPHPSHVAPSISIEHGQWIALNGQRVLWLPIESRPSRFKINGNVLALGHASGRVSFIGFCM